MFDPVAHSLAAISGGSPSAFGLVFLAGLVTSVGPCAAPRLIAISGATAHQSAPHVFRTILSFVAGIVLAYASFGVLASGLASLVTLSRYVYVAAAVAFFFGGTMTLLRNTAPACPARACVHEGSIGGPFMLGASFALVISPCCTPIVTAILAYCLEIHSPVYAAALLGMFALGHAVPIVGLGSGVATFRRLTSRLSLHDALRVVSGALMFAVGGYYLCLA